MRLLILPTITRENPSSHQKTKIRRIFPKKTLRKLFYQPFNVSIFKPTSRITLHKHSINTVLKHFELRAMAEISYQFVSMNGNATHLPI